MHYTTAKKVWDNLQELHEEVSKEDFSGNPISNNVSKLTYGVVGSKEDKLEELFDLRTKLDLVSLW